MSRLDPHREEIIERLKQGESLKSIASSMGYDPQTLTHWLNKKDIPYRQWLVRNKSMKLDALQNEIEIHLKQGKSLRYIKVLIGCNYRTLRGWLLKKGIPYHHWLTCGVKTKKLAKHKKAIIEKLRRGEMLISIAKKMGCTPTTLSDWLNKEKIPYQKWLKHGSKRGKLEKNKQEIIVELQRRETLTSIAKKMGRSSAALRDWLNKEKIPYRKCLKHGNKRRKLEKNKKAIIMKLKRGETLISISKKMGCTSEALRKWLNKENVSYQQWLTHQPNKIKTMLDQRRDEIIKRIKKGESLRSLARDVGCESTALINWFNRLGIHYKKWLVCKPHKIQPIIIQKRNEIIKRLKQGESIQSISKNIECSQKAIRYWLNKEKIPYRQWLIKKPHKVQEKLEQNRKEIVDLLKQGESLVSVSRLLNCARSTLTNWLNKEEIPYRQWLIHKRHLTCKLNKHRDEIILRLKQGETIEAVADSMERSSASLRNWLYQQRIPYRQWLVHKLHERQHWLDHNRDRIINRLQNGESLISVASSMNCDSTSLVAWLINNDIPYQQWLINGNKIKKLTARKSEIVARLKQGETLASLANSMGCSISLLHYWLKQKNISYHQWLYHKK